VGGNQTIVGEGDGVSVNIGVGTGAAKISAGEQEVNSNIIARRAYPDEAIPARDRRLLRRRFAASRNDGE